MTEDEVVAAAHGLSVPATAGDQHAERSRDGQVRLKAPVTWAGFAFTAYYAFDQKGRLVSVTLQLQERDESAAKDLREFLTRQYGAPSSQLDEGDVALATWVVGPDQVGYMRLRDASTAVGAPVTSLNYQPMP